MRLHACNRHRFPIEPQKAQRVISHKKAHKAQKKKPSAEFTIFVPFVPFVATSSFVRFVANRWET
jgi:hypothetical protein